VSTGEKQRRRGLTIAQDDTVHAEVAETTKEAVRTYLIDDIVPRTSSGKVSAAAAFSWICSGAAAGFAVPGMTWRSLFLRSASGNGPALPRIR